ncbi:putative bifunctional diguanylate cyclase/phosphodiesterase [Azonexus sp. IMCC34839]|uniref:putative bifunctional diguanylate cyclase/phosphodiesterase n=1 Tax=Azonexus sp. IMCC34839 TaxID=3133695 RepID=UPI00399BCA60
MKSVKSKLQALLLLSILLALTLAGILLSLGVRYVHQDASRSHLVVGYNTLRNQIEQLSQKSERVAHGMAADATVISSLNMLSGYATQGEYQPLVFDPEKRRLARDAARQLMGTTDVALAIFDSAGSLAAYAVSADNGTVIEGIVSYELGQPVYLTGDGGNWHTDNLPARIEDLVKQQGYEDRYQRTRASEFGLHIEFGIPVVRIARGDIVRTVGSVVVSQILGESFIAGSSQNTALEVGLVLGKGLALGQSAGLDDPNMLAKAPQLFAPVIPDDAGWHESESRFSRAYALSLTGGGNAYFVLSADQELVARQIRQTLLVILGVLVLAALIVLPLGVHIAERWISEPVRNLIGRVVHIREGRYELVQAMPPGQGEFNELALALREMANGIREREERLRIWNRVIAESREAIIVTDPQERILAVNPAFTTVTGYSAEEAIGQTPRILQSGQHDRDFYLNMWQSLTTTGHWQGEVWDRAKNGRIYPKWLAITAVRDEQDQIANFIAIFSDVSEHKATLAQIQFLAHHDALTLLPNRALLQDRLTQSISSMQREAGKLAVLFMDLDRFKNVNDSLGHNIGDGLLKSVAARLRHCVRETDTVSRFGGDEFVIVLARLRSADDAAMVADSILKAVAEPIRIEGYELRVTPSIGISIGPDDGADPAVLIKNADAAMYHAKERGRNNYQFYSADMNERAERRLNVESGLRRAIENGEFLLAYQPKVEVATGRCVGVEALIRWRRPDGGFVSPLEFIPLAEDTGLILPIGEWVLREACRQQQAWLAGGVGLVQVAVNISAVQFQSPGFVAQARSIMREYDVTPGSVELELTESIVMRDPEQVARVLVDLKREGFMLAIDDFGTGYSSLSYLKRFPLDKLKIDASFVRDISRDSTDRAIARSVVALGASLGLQVVAEGVEGMEELKLLHEMGCSQAQGYYFAKPLPADEFVAWLQTYVPSAMVREDDYVI